MSDPTRSSPSQSARLRRQIAQHALFPAVAQPVRVGRFEVDSILGVGSMGTVFRALDPQLARPVAIKVLKTSAGPSGRARLLTEARALARINHPNVVTIFDVGFLDDQPFIAMELVAGQTLRTWAQTQSTTAILKAYQFAAQGLSAVHAAGLVHRDFKPANVLMGLDGVPRVADFGLVRDPHHSIAHTYPIADWSGTQTGSLLGTPAYMAPEQISGGVVGPAADQFAFCVSLYHTLTGVLPTNHRTGEAPPRLGLSSRHHLVLCRGMALDPAARWPNMKALAAALSGERHRGRVWMAGSALAIVGAVGLWLGLAARQMPPTGEAQRPPIMALTQTDPAVATRVLAQSDPSPDWRRAARQVLQMPLSTRRLPLSNGGHEAQELNGEIVVELANQTTLRWTGQDWRHSALPPTAARAASLLQMPAEVFVQRWIRGLDWGMSCEFRVSRARALVCRQSGWFMRWTADGLEPIRPDLWSQVLSTRGAGRMLAFNPGGPVWSVPLDGTTAARPIPGSTGSVVGAGDSKSDALVLADGTVLLAPVDGPVRTLGRVVPPPHGLRFSPDEQWLAAIGPTTRIWHLEGQYPPFDPPGRWSAPGAFSADSQRIVLVRDHQLFEYSLATHQVRIGRGHAASIRNVARSKQGWLTVAEDGSVRDWRMTAATRIGQMPAIWSASLGPKGQRVVAAGRGGAVGVFDITTGQTVARWQHAGGKNAYKARFSPAGDAVLSGSADGVARLWRLDGGAPIELPGHATWAYAVAISPDGTTLATADRDGTVRLWSRDGRLVRTWPSFDPAEFNRIHKLFFSRDGAALTWGHRDGPVFWSTLTDAPRLISTTNGAVGIAPSGHAYTYMLGRDVRVFSPEGRFIEQHTFDTPANAVFGSPVSDQLAVFTLDRHVHFQTIGGERTTYGPLGGVVEFAAFSPDGTRIALGYPEGSVEVMTIATGERWRLGTHDNDVRAVIWAQPATLVTAGMDGQVLRWDVRSDDAALRERLNAATRICLTALERQSWLGEDEAAAEMALERCRSGH